ncbi:hypothetical protein RhiirA4_462124 [Rhizophagus irregularis]|uniref:Uncharacterized protein n=1 Tax=Rhizophagus irregularis TaxID=588596 RepID=A0A2I1GKB4_9GLOM|nr:hypothetical protein RhiirA4_462124 [Rhizophagus irregularis]
MTIKSTSKPVKPIPIKAPDSSNRTSIPPIPRCSSTPIISQTHNNLYVDTKSSGRQ